MSFLGDLGEGLVGAGGGALSGFLMSGGNPYAAAGGAALGGVGGYMNASSRSSAADSQRRSIDQAMARLQDLSKQNYADRMKDLDATLAFYNPAQQQYAKMFGGQTYHQGAPPPPGAPPMGGPPPGAPPMAPGSRMPRQVPMGGGGPPRPAMPMNPPGFPPMPGPTGKPMAPMGRLGVGGY